MAFEFGGVSSEVTISGDVTTELGEKEITSAEVDGVTSTTTIFTPAAGKRAKIVGCFVSARSSSGFGGTDVEVNGVVIAKSITYGAQNQVFYKWDYNCCPIAESGEVVRAIVGTGSPSMAVVVHYVLEDNP